MKREMKVDEAQDVCKDRSKWRLLTPMGKRHE